MENKQITKNDFLSSSILLKNNISKNSNNTVFEILLKLEEEMLEDLNKEKEKENKKN